LRKLLSIVLLAIALITLTLSPVQAATTPSKVGAKVFNANCAACHMGGNNVILPSKTLKKEALDKYAMNSLEAVKTQVTKGRNAMPAFAGRLTEDQIAAVSAYILEQAQKGW